MKFLHTSDWHIGLKAQHLGRAGEKARLHRLAAAGRIAALARDENVDFVLLAGDTFDSPDVRPQWVLQTVEVLESMGRPVYVLPGNHDPDVPAGLWSHPIWQQRPNIRVCRAAAPVDLPGATLYPCPVTSRWLAGVPTAWIPRSTGGNVVRIALAHAGIVTPAAPELRGALPSTAAADLGLDYIALGDWHSTTAALDTRIAHSGTPEATAFDERDCGNVLIVDIPAAGAMPRITKRRVAQLEWRQIERRLQNDGDARALLEEIRGLASETRLLDVSVSGTVDGDGAAALDEIDGALDAGFLFGRLRRGPLTAAGAAARLPLGFVSDAAERLAKQAERGDAVAGEALLELNRIAREVGA